MAARIKSFSKTFVWILLGLLVAGLAGFGATNLTGTVRTVATVGDQSVSVDQYARELQREIRAVEAQTGQPMQMSQAIAMGLDRMVLGQLVALAALDHEVAQLGLSVGDARLQQDIVSIPAFQGVDGKFDRETYRFALEQAGLSEAEFEADLRAEAARTLVQGAVIGGVRMPAVMADTLIGYVLARRSFTLARLTAADLAEPLAEPGEDQLKAYYDAHPDRFTLPETKQLSYLWLTPEMILDQIELEPQALRQLYDQRQDQYDLPERRLVERLVFADQAEAASAMAQIEVGGTTFEALVGERQLSLSDVDLGDVAAADLGQAADAVFAADIGDVVGPLPSDLGPALFRINGVLAARRTTFDEAAPELRDELAAERARRLIESRAEEINDLLAGGATLEELAEETDMQLGQIDWTTDSSDGIAAYDAFRETAAAVGEEDYPEVAFLEDGGIFALRLDAVLAPRPEPFDQARDRVIDGWTQQQTEAALTVQAQAAIADLEAAGLPLRRETGLTRSAYLDGTAPDFMTQLFEMEQDETRIIASGDGSVDIVRLDAILPPAQTADLNAMQTAFGQELDQALAQALFDAFVQDAQTRARPELNQRALNAVQSSLQ